MDMQHNLSSCSSDGDWVSPLEDEQFDSFLLDEWRGRKQSSFVFYSRLSVFFREHYPNINLATEEEKEHLIRDLSVSGSFARSRSILRQLAGQADSPLSSSMASRARPRRTTRCPGSLRTLIFPGIFGRSWGHPSRRSSPGLSRTSNDCSAAH